MSKRNWITRRGFLGVSAGLLSAAPSAFPLSAQSRSAAEGGSLPLIEGFLDPDNDARPGAYWIWVNGNFDIAQLTREPERRAVRFSAFGAIALSGRRRQPPAD